MWMLLWMLTVVVGQDTQLRQDYSSQEINEDLDRMYAILSSMHPGLHLYTTPKDLRRSFEQARVPVGESRSLRSAYMSFASIVDQVRCGHTYATVPTSAQTELTRDAVFFPLPLKFIEGRALRQPSAGGIAVWCGSIVGEWPSDAEVSASVDAFRYCRWICELLPI